MDEAPIPVNIVTGFLGSGKTTLLRHVLAHPAFARAAVLINEFGEVGLDHLLVERLDPSTVLMESGCICCTLQEDLRTGLRNLHARRARGEVPRFDRVIIETTGLADPAPVMATVMNDAMLRHHMRIGSVVATVDAVNAPTSLGRFAESRKQVALADRVLLTKVDIADEDQCARAHEHVAALNPHARIERTVQGAAGPDVLAGIGSADPAERSAEARQWLDAALSARARLRTGPAPEIARARLARFHGEDGAEADEVRTLVVTLDEPVEWTAFGLWLSLLVERHGEKILRLKALLNVEGSPTPVVVHGVHALLHPAEHLERWPGEARQSLLVFIVQGLSPALLERSLRSFLKLGARVREAESAGQA
ncbi:CobW family GTP-binding protein [Ancylobacter mangrovi]|uniref:CobW family GTP-binding protein n=1 Tax=Ancylobacter mangrovi TaxID=2972472 RepID=UPI002161B2C8|nr:GTP-binding protein [Ancylobacter mangrovi]MCS0503269.1 GTP-binding protein [Ancylobacter mangrovi]